MAKRTRIESDPRPFSELSHLLTNSSHQQLMSIIERLYNAMVTSKDLKLITEAEGILEEHKENIQAELSNNDRLFGKWKLGGYDYLNLVKLGTDVSGDYLIGDLGGNINGLRDCTLADRDLTFDVDARVCKMNCEGEMTIRILKDDKGEFVEGSVEIRSEDPYGYDSETFNEPFSFRLDGTEEE